MVRALCMLAGFILSDRYKNTRLDFVLYLLSGINSFILMPLLFSFSLPFFLYIQKSIHPHIGQEKHFFC